VIGRRLAHVLTSRTADELAGAIAGGGWLASGSLLALAALTILGNYGNIHAAPVLGALLAVGLVNGGTIVLWAVCRLANRAAWRWIGRP